ATIAPPGVNHERRDGHNRSGTALSGRRKLSDVATQIQYFVVADPRCIDVRSHAASQTIDAKSRWISMECDTRAICSSMSLPSTAAIAFTACRVLKSLQISERDCTGLDQIRNEQVRRPTEQIKEISNESGSILALIDCRLEQLRIADFLYLAQRAFFLEPVHERLNRRIRNAFFLGQTLEDFADGAGSQLPALLEDSCFGFGKTGLFHISYACRLYYYNLRSTSR